MAELYRSLARDSEVDERGHTVDESAERLVDTGLFSYDEAYAAVTGVPQEPGWTQYQVARAALLQPKNIVKQRGNGNNA